MNRNFRMRAAALAAALSLSLLLASCGGGSIVTAEDPQTGGVTVTADNAGKDSGGSGYVTIAEGDCLVISPALDKGSFTVSVYPMAGEPTEDDTGIAEEAVLEESIEGNAMTAYELEPGEYAVLVNVEKTATGTMLILPKNIEELAAENESLAEALAEALS